MVSKFNVTLTSLLSPFRLLSLLSFLTCPAFIYAQADPPEGVKITEIPTWVTSTGQVTTEADASDGGWRYHWVDYQHHLESNTRFEHYLVGILNESGVESFSQLDFEFNPEYEELHLHHVTIQRGEEVQERLGETKIELLRREEDMDYRLYDGELTALLILNDIRPGDLLSYSFSRVGKNPVFDDHAHHTLRLGFTSAIDHIRRRVLWDPQARSLAWQILGEGVDQPTESPIGTLKELVWEKENPSRLKPEDSVPNWYFDIPWLEYSDFTDWEDFGEWALQLFDQDSTMPELLLTACEEINAQATTDEERMIGVLRWVQRNIRYLGSFFGEHTHEPYPLEEICLRRFGDCKDKGMVTIAMLRHFGYDAAPALVDTYHRKGAAAFLPGHAPFDHLIVHLRWEGQDYLLDPTYTYQRGPLHQVDLNDYGYAFFVRPGENSLRTVEERGNEVDRTIVTETYNVPEKQGGADYIVKTVATGGDANSLRRYFSNNDYETITDDYTEFYASEYPGIEATQPVSFEDNEESNTIVVQEYYRIPDFWEEDEGNSRWIGSVSATYLNSRLTYPPRHGPAADQISFALCCSIFDGIAALEAMP